MANFTNNTIQLQNLLAKVNELPEASGNSNVETCTLKIESDGAAYATGIYYTAFEDNEYHYYVKSEGLDNISDYPIYIENVVLNSPIEIEVGGFQSYISSNSNFSYKNLKNCDVDNTIYLEEGYFLPTKPDENGYIVIKCISDD